MAVKIRNFEKKKENFPVDDDDDGMIVSCMFQFFLVLYIFFPFFRSSFFLLQFFHLTLFNLEIHFERKKSFSRTFVLSFYLFQR